MLNKVKKASQNQLRRICCILVKEVTDDLTFDQANAIIGGQKILEEQIRTMLKEISSSVTTNNVTYTDKQSNESRHKALIAEEFDRFEAVFGKALEIAKVRNPMQTKVHLEDLAEVLNCSHPTVGRIFRFRDAWKYIPGLVRFNLIKDLSREFPQRWFGLRSTNSPFAKHFRL